MQVDFLTQLRNYTKPLVNLSVEDEELYRRLLLLAVIHEQSTEQYMESQNIPYKLYEGDVDIEYVKKALMVLYPKRKVRGFRRAKNAELYDNVELLAYELNLTLTEALWELGFESVIPTENDKSVILSVMEVIYPNKVVERVTSLYPRLFRCFLLMGKEEGITAKAYIEKLGYTATGKVTSVG